MASIALKRGGSFSSSGGSSEHEHVGSALDLGYGPTGDRYSGGGGGGGGLGSNLDLGYGPMGGKHGGGGGGTLDLGYGPMGGGRGGVGAGLYGSSLTSLQYQAPRRDSFLRNNSRSSGLGCNDNDDLSLLGECDVSSTRSREVRPGRRASLSTAIQLTQSPPKRNASGSRPRGRRNSLFGSSGGNSGKDKDKDPDAATTEALARLSMKQMGGSRRASMAGYPAAEHLTTQPAEPEPTPQFFATRKKDKSGRNVPSRKKSTSFDRDDPRAKKMLAKIKRPGNRRASMSAVPLGRGLARSNSKNSVNSGKSNSAGSHSNSYSDYSEEDDENNILGHHKKHHPHNHHHGPNNNNNHTRVTPGRSASYGMERSKAVAAAELGYGDPDEDYDPQLPPPPIKGLTKRAMQNRRGSTGTAFGFKSNVSAQKSLKESLQWKHQQNPQGAAAATAGPYERQNHRASFIYSQDKQALLAKSLALSHQNRRGSTASSVATSTATDIASNVRQQQQLQHILQQQQNPDSTDGNISYGTPHATPQQHERPKIQTMLGTSGAPKGMYLDDSSSNTYDLDETPIQSNRKTRDTLFDRNNINFNNSEISQSGLSTMGHASSLLDPMMDGSDGSHERYGTPLSSPVVTPQASPAGHARASRGLSMMQQRPLGSVGGAATGGNRASITTTHRASLLGFSNPYGSNLRDDDDDDDDEEEEDLLAPKQNKQKEQKLEKEKRAAAAAEAEAAAAEAEASQKQEKMSEHSADDKVNKGHSVGKATTNTTVSTTDEESSPTLAATSGTITTNSTQASFEHLRQIYRKKKKNDDDSDHDSMTSEAPKEKAPVLEGEHNQNPLEENLEEIGATGDWSAGVTDTMLHHPRAKSIGKNSLLDRYPGSDTEDIDLGYGHGPKAMNAYDDESERKDGDPDYEYDNGYGPSDLYDEDYSSFGWREHRPRAAESMEFIDMEQLMSKAKNTKGLYLPTFIPAHGCTNASDFIVRCFVARLRAGMTVTKHSRSRFCKSHDRILHILPTGYHITWIPDTEEEVVAKSSKKPPTKLDLTKCLEVRHAWSRDPKSLKYTGTATLRSKCKEGAANRSFALIYPKRTVDFTAASVDQCKILMEGFSALCFRLQMAKLEQQSGENDDETQHTGISGMDNDNESTTASLTGTNLSAPWGL